MYVLQASQDLWSGTLSVLLCQVLMACDSKYQVAMCMQFLERGCENCQYLNMDGDSNRVSDCTTVNFTG